MELGRLQRAKQAFDEAGIDIVAVCVDAPAQLRAARGKAHAAYTFLSDHEGALMDTFGIRHVNASPYGGDIAQSASFLVDREGVVRWRYATPNYRVRIRPEDVLAQVKDVLARP